MCVVEKQLEKFSTRVHHALLNNQRDHEEATDAGAAMWQALQLKVAKPNTNLAGGNLHVAVLALFDVLILLEARMTVIDQENKAKEQA
jgi:hypothetical protein